RAVTAIPFGQRRRLRHPELITYAAQGEPERTHVALELPRGDEKRGKGLAADTLEAERLPIALARLERRKGHAASQTLRTVRPETDWKDAHSRSDRCPLA